MSLAKLYASSVRNQLKYYGVWEPGQLIKLGDYGYLEDNIFKQKGSIKDLSIKIKERKNPEESHKKFQSASDTNVEFGAGATVGGDVVKANMKISFGSGNSVFFNAAGCTSVSIENKEDIGKRLIELKKEGTWDASYVVVMEIIKAKSAQVFISKTANAEVVLEADSPLIGEINLADASLNLNVKTEKSLGYKYVGKKTVLLQQLWGLKKKFLSSRDVLQPKEVVGRDIENSNTEADFEFEIQ